MRYTNQMRDVYTPGTDITGHASAAVRGKTFARIAGPRTGGLVSVTTAQAAGRACGVFKYDANTDDLVGIARGSARVVTVAAEAALQAGDEVEVGSAGGATTHATGVAVGYCVDDAASGDDALVSLY